MDPKVLRTSNPPPDPDVPVCIRITNRDPVLYLEHHIHPLIKSFLCVSALPTMDLKGPRKPYPPPDPDVPVCIGIIHTDPMLYPEHHIHPLIKMFLCVSALSIHTQCSTYNITSIP